MRIDKIVTTRGLDERCMALWCNRPRPKIAKIPSLKSRSFRERRACHADQSRDLCGCRGRPRLVDGAGAGQQFETAAGRRATGVIVVQRDAADGGRNVAAAAVSGTGFPAATPAQIRGARFGAADALSAAWIVSVMPGLVPGIHVLLRRKTWMAGTSPAMTIRTGSAAFETQR
jgi:hypothetical protein